jgi:hypothetical protein
VVERHFVVGLVGGRDYKVSQYNRAADAKRQRGSAFKLFVYLTALREGSTPDHRVMDAPVRLGNWTPQQCVDFLVARVGHERANAEAEVRRSAQAPPLYQAAYLLGGLQLRALYKELVDGGRMSATQFHDAILLGGPMPIGGPIGIPAASVSTPRFTPDLPRSVGFRPVRSPLLAP